MSNLQNKWQDMFHFLDINNDSVLDMADMMLIQDNFVRLHNLTSEEVCANFKTMHKKSKYILITVNVIFINEVVHVYLNHNYVSALY